MSFLSLKHDFYRPITMERRLWFLGFRSAVRLASAVRGCAESSIDRYCLIAGRSIAVGNFLGPNLPRRGRNASGRSLYRRPDFLPDGFLSTIVFNCGRCLRGFAGDADAVTDPLSAIELRRCRDGRATPAATASSSPCPALSPRSHADQQLSRQPSPSIFPVCAFLS